MNLSKIKLFSIYGMLAALQPVVAFAPTAPVAQWRGIRLRSIQNDVSQENNVFVSKYPSEISKCEAMLDKESAAPFSVDTGNGVVWYYLSAACDKEKIATITGKAHNCNHCRHRMRNCAGYFGPDGYAVDFGGVENGGPLYSQIEHERQNLKDASSFLLESQRSFIVSQKNLDKFPRELGVSKHTGLPFFHLGLNIPQDSSYVTDPALADSISPKLLSSLWNGSLDGRLQEIITMLQKRDELSGMTDLDVIKSVAKQDNVLRKDFWRYRIDAVDSIQQFARRFKHGDSDWNRMSDVDKMHVRMFALLYGGQYTEESNPTFQATGLVIDISKDADGIDAIPAFMNDRSDPAYYMVQSVARANLKRSVVSPFVVSLAWKDNADLDAHIFTENEHIFYSNKRSWDGETFLNFDANGAASPTDEPVETMSLSSKSPGKYSFFVNNYKNHGNSDAVPFTVVVSLNGDTKTYRDGWDCRIRGDNPGDDKSRMMEICTIQVTQETIDQLQGKPQLSANQANRLGHLLPLFNKRFGNITTSIVDMSTLDGNILIAAPRSRQARDIDGEASAMLNELSELVTSSTTLSNDRTALRNSDVRSTLSSRSRPGDATTLESLLSDNSMTIGIRGRNFYPSTMTTHSCGDQLKRQLVVNSYIEEGKPPVQPNPHLVETCRFEKEWSRDFASILQATAAVPVSHPLYNGYFLSLENTHLAVGPTWCDGGGMYATTCWQKTINFVKSGQLCIPRSGPKSRCRMLFQPLASFCIAARRTNWLSMVWTRRLQSNTVRTQASCLRVANQMSTLI